MSPTPVTFVTPNQPSAYTWEATDEEVAARYGIPLEDVVRFDLNTAPAPPDLAQRVMEAGRFHVSLSEYPPADYRLLVEAAAARYGVGMDELVVGAGAERHGPVAVFPEQPDRPPRTRRRDRDAARADRSRCCVRRPARPDRGHR